MPPPGPTEKIVQVVSAGIAAGVAFRFVLLTDLGNLYEMTVDDTGTVRFAVIYGPNLPA
jgi:hypothetical protein